MQTVRLAILSFACACLVIAVAACSTAGGAPSFTYAPPAASTPPASSPTAGPTASPSPTTASALPSPAAGVTVTLTEWKVAVAGAIKAGKSDLKIENVGVAQHELLIFKSKLAPSAYPTDAAGDIKEEGAGVSLVSDGDNIDPQGSQIRSIDLAPGTYLFVCNIPGHFKQGMFTTVTVSP